MLVKTNTPPKINKIKPKVPLTVPVKYKTAKTAAKINRITLSVEPILLFITIYFLDTKNKRKDINRL